MSVSVVIAVHNLENYVQDCLESVAAQELDQLQVVIVDDASTDGSLPIIRAWSERQNMPVTVIAHEHNRGALRTYNDGLRACTNEYISLLDGDDLLEPGALRAHCALLHESAPEVAVVYGDVEFVAHDGSPLHERYLDGMTPLEGDLFVPLIEHGSVLTIIGTVMRRSVVETVGGFDERLAYLDWPLWLKIGRHHQFVYSGRVAGQYRQHPTSMSQTRGAEIRLSRMAVLSELLEQRPSPVEQLAIKNRSVRVARSMWSANDGDAARRACRQLLRRTRDPRLAGALIAMWLRVPHRQVKRITHRFGHRTWRTHPRDI